MIDYSNYDANDLATALLTFIADGNSNETKHLLNHLEENNKDLKTRIINGTIEVAGKKVSIIEFCIKSSKNQDFLSLINKKDIIESLLSDGAPWSKELEEIFNQKIHYTLEDIALNLISEGKTGYLKTQLPPHYHEDYLTKPLNNYLLLTIKDFILTGDKSYEQEIDQILSTAGLDAVKYPAKFQDEKEDFLVMPATNYCAYLGKSGDEEMSRSLKITRKLLNLGLNKDLKDNKNRNLSECIAFYSPIVNKLRSNPSPEPRRPTSESRSHNRERSYTM